MDGMEAVLEPETVEVESPEGVSTPESGGENQVGKPEDAAAKADRDYKAWLKAQRDADPEKNGKFARQSKDNHERLRELVRTEPRGIEGIRETYAALDSVVHGELKGIAAVGAIQDELRGIAEVDAAIAEGKPEVLEQFDDRMKVGIVKMTPAILDMAREMDSDAYSAAVLPHFVEALRNSELVRDFNGLVDVFNEAAPKWLTEGQKAQWQEDKMTRVTGLVAQMSKWFNAQAAKAGELKQVVPGKQGAKTEQTPEQTRIAELEKNERDAHWNTQITPNLDKHANAKFDEVFRPYAKRLNLDKGTAQALRSEFASRVSKMAAKPLADGKQNPYIQQIARYRQQGKPDPNTVLNFAKVEFDKHAKSVMEGLVNERYKSFLNGRPQAKPSVAGTKTAPAAPGVQIVTVKPKNIDFKATPLDWLHQKKYRTTDGKVVQVRR